jgi:signal transduction histidine kinase
MDDKCVIRADAELTYIVWNNLLSNALKFTESGGKVRLMQTSEPDSVTVTVSDTGCGIGARVIGRVFDKLYQGDSSHSGEGNGLGLALAKRVTDILGGQISVTSEVGKGSVFSVTLPLE